MKLMKVLKIILGTLLGLIVFFLIQNLSVWIIGQLARIPYVDTVIYWPSAFPLVVNLLPPLAAIHVAAFTCDAIGDNTKPLSILLMVFYGYQIVQGFLAGSFSWQGILTNVIGIAIAFICYR